MKLLGTDPASSTDILQIKASAWALVSTCPVCISVFVTHCIIYYLLLMFYVKSVANDQNDKRPNFPFRAWTIVNGHRKI